MGLDGRPGEGKGDWEQEDTTMGQGLADREGTDSA